MRQIEPKMLAFLDEKLFTNGLAQEAIKAGEPRVVFLQAMMACVGIREESNNAGPMVELIQETLGDAGKEAWCMALVQTCLAYAEVRCGVKSPVFPSEHCLTTWRKTPIQQRVNKHPLPGAIAIWQHFDKDGKPTSAGHTGAVVGCDENMFQAIEGNTTSGVLADGSLVREGGGVYFTKNRGRIGNGTLRVLGFLKPF